MGDSTKKGGGSRLQQTLQVSEVREVSGRHNGGSGRHLLETRDPGGCTASQYLSQPPTLAPSFLRSVPPYAQEELFTESPSCRQSHALTSSNSCLLYY